MITLGMKLSPTGPVYVINEFSASTKHHHRLADRGSEIVKVPARWMFNPGYMHSFSVTRRYFVLVEQPLTVSVKKMVGALLKNRTVMSALQWRDRGVVFHVVDKVTGKRTATKYVADSFFFLHTINAYEEDDQVVIDICAYKSP